jgi:hypothetical protein
MKTKLAAIITAALVDDGRKLAVAVFLGLFAWLGYSMLTQLQEQHQRNLEMWGPNPGTVEYETSLGGNGTMVIRDKDHAEEEVRAKLKEIWDDLRANPNFTVKGNPDEYTFTKFVVK